MGTYEYTGSQVWWDSVRGSENLWGRHATKATVYTL